MAKKQKINASAAQPVSTSDDDGAAPADGHDSFLSGRNLYIILGLTIGCLLLYGQTIGFDFITLDDGGYVFENRMVLHGLSTESIRWAFTTFEQANWHPLTWLSLLTDSTLFGTKPGTYHLVNTLFHTANAALLYIVLKRATGAMWQSAFAAALFAFHPMHVESVAWIAERKDVLSTLFWLLTTYFYLRYVNDGRQKYYILTIIAMALGLMAKPMIVTLPFVLLLLDYWPLGRFEKPGFATALKLVREKIPLFALSLVSCWLTVVAQSSGGAVASLETIPLVIRVQNALVAYAGYFVSMFYPVDLGVAYPYETDIPTGKIAGAVALLAIVSVYAIWRRRERKYLIVGWLWFIGTLVPVIGFVQVGAQGAADRYTYIPYIGLGIGLVWFAADLLQNRSRRLAAVAAAVVLVILGFCTFSQAGFWRSSETLYLHTIAVTRKNAFIEQNLCLFYLDGEKLVEAELQCRNAIADAPTYPTPYRLLGRISFKQNRVADSVINYLAAIRIKPDDLASYSDLTVVYLSGGNANAAAELNDKLANRGGADQATGQILFENFGFIGLAYIQKNDFAQAGVYLEKALALKAGDSTLLSNYGLALYRTGRKEDGLRLAGDAVRQNPRDADALYIYGTILAAEGRRDEAITQLENALRLKPDLAPASEELKKLQGVKQRP